MVQHLYQLPFGYTVEFRLAGQRLDVEWSPCLPPSDTAPKLMPAYKNARRQFLGGLGLDALVIEL